MNFAMNNKFEYVTLYDPGVCSVFMFFVARLANLVFICLHEAIAVVCFAIASA